MEIRSEKEAREYIEELDRITKMLVKRDFELMKERQMREDEVLELIKMKEELESQNKELNKMNHLMVGRENRMMEIKKEMEKLKEENDRLRKKLGLEPEEEGLKP